MASTALPLTETPDRHGAFPRLSDEQIEALTALGERRRTKRGQTLFREGDERYDFVVILAGMVATVHGRGRDEQLIAVHGPGRFLGEIGLLSGQPAFFTAIVREPGEVLVVTVEKLRQQVAGDPGFGDLILRAFLERRALLIGLGAGVQIVGSRYSADTRRLLEFVARNRVPHRWIDLEEDSAAEALLRGLGVAPEDTPVVVCRAARVLRNPSNAQVARALGLAAPAGGPRVWDLVVVGAGPAGLAAAVYGASEGFDTIALDAIAPGGQAATSSRIENYLGFPSGISGGELAERARIQADKFGARISVPGRVTALEDGDTHHVVRLEDGSTLASRTVLIATGAHYRRLHAPGLERLEGTSVFYAATQTEARMCAGDPVAVVGGGNSGGQAALFLARHAAAVRLVVRERSLETSMSRYLADRIERDRGIEVLLETEVLEPIGHGRLEGLVVVETPTGRRRRLDARALFVFIGLEPCTGWLAGCLDLDAKGFVVTGRALQTSHPGVLAAGDVRSGSIRRVAAAVGEGSMAVRVAYEYLRALGRSPRAQT
jgi:thioredoxin reductase (NADPH)